MRVLNIDEIIMHPVSLLGEATEKYIREKLFQKKEEQGEYSTCFPPYSNFLSQLGNMDMS